MSEDARQDELLLPVYAPPPPVFVRGRGARIWDEDGREYIDLSGGVAVNTLGHAPPQVTAAVTRQAQQLLHLSNVFLNRPALRLAEFLIEHTFARRVFFCNSGAEANEAAIKAARRRGVSLNADKHKVLSFSGGFHGRIGMAMAATPQAKVRDGFGPLAAGFISAPFNDAAAARKAADDSLCAIIVEPVQGEGGVHIATINFLRELCALADQHDALLIFDEVQCGAARGAQTLFAHQQFGVEPDIATAAKGVGGGFPFGFALFGERAQETLTAGAHGSTFGGNPAACAAALAVLETLGDDEFLKTARARAQTMAAELAAMNEEFGCFDDIRQFGMLAAADLPAQFSAREVFLRAVEEGVLILTAGENALRLAPPLNIGEAELRKGLRRLRAALPKR